MKQRLIGITVLMVLIIAIVLLLLYGARQGDRFNAPEEKNLGANKAEVQLTLPAEKETATANTASNGAANEQQAVVQPQVEVNADNAAVAAPTAAATAATTATPAVSATATTTATSSADAAATANTTDTTAVTPVVNSNAEVSAPISGQFGQVAPVKVKSNGKLIKNKIKNVTPILKKVATTTATTEEASAVNADTTTANAAAEQAAPVSSTEEVATTSSEENQPKAIVSKAKPVHKMIKVKKTVKPVKAVQAHKGWSVKVGSFVAPPHAQALIKQFKAHGYHAYSGLVVTKTHGVLTQVFVGPVATRNEAVKLSQSITTTFKIKGAVVIAK
jgi:cell division septation protein DedD